MAITRSAVRNSKELPSSKKASPSARRTTHTFKGPEKTADGRHIIVNNRKWRATDPLIPEEALGELKHYLARGRAGVRGMKQKGKTEADDDIRLARMRTGLAKLGLGERGEIEWWEDTEEGRRVRWEKALTDLKMLDR
ncbi:MAG: hypothetical protein CYPHOPRED_004533 [Cyphobasidiales sp. Tagirdzhanova-0007]|nr:MAG: hypothetical protein CYPHOPRED_004533 [Cyphobasidiales sp. Tagirdzhanova-0007]